MDRRSFIAGTALALWGIRRLDPTAMEQLVDPTPEVVPEATLSMSALDDIFKNLYLPAVRDQLNSPSILLGELDA